MGAFESINLTALIEEDAFVDARWRIVYSAAVILRVAGTQVCAESISDFIASRQLDKELQRAIDPSDTISWRKWPDFADMSLVHCPSSRPLEYCMGELRYLYSKRLAAQIGSKLQEGIIPLPEAIASLREVVPGLNGAITRPLVTFAAEPPDPKQTLLGNRFLCREGGMLFVGPSGIGKTAASIQQDLLWSVGLPAFGIAPAKALKILVIGAEDDDGDLSEIVAGIKAHLLLTPEQIALSERNCLYVSEKSTTGIAFLERIVAPLLTKCEPDILRINPLQAYLGGDIKDSELTATWLRNTLNPLLVTHRCAVILVHHTPKTQFRNTAEWKASDWMYAGAGTADITNWARAALIIDSTEDPRIFRFIAAKRGARIGWANNEGESVATRYFSHSKSSNIFWSQIEEPESPNQPRQAGQFQAKFTTEDIFKLMSAIEPFSTSQIKRLAENELGMSKATFFRLWDSAKKKGQLIQQNDKWLRA
jgi:hypothetical protein